ncbi:hypothetical protein [Amycolatopsis sp. NPDC004079]|uniref:hypothetical protein n=1 Tax=Amycolatopsis sp. NPDC004079 TaxID=3154549 RepID=UPI0033A8100F
MITEIVCPVTCPPLAPEVGKLVSGDTLGDSIIVEFGDLEEHGVYHCWECGKAFISGQTGPIVRYGGPDDDPADLRGFHERCAERYRKRCVPLVVTVHPDSTASATGPGRDAGQADSVTVRIETPILFVAVLSYRYGEFVFTAAGTSAAEALELMRQRWEVFQGETVAEIATEAFDSLQDQVDIHEMQPGYIRLDC